MKKVWFDGYQVKLLLYVTTASLTALLSDLQHYLCGNSGELKVSFAQTFIIFINFVLQGLIAWRAFIDDSVKPSEKDLEVPTKDRDNKKEH